MFLQYVHEMLTYRLRIILMVISNFATPIVMLLVLQSIDNRSGLSTQQLVSYYIFTTILALSMRSRVDEFVQESIEEGGLATYLIRPVHFWLIALTNDLSSRILKLLFGIPVFLVLLFIYSRIHISVSWISTLTIAGMILLSFSLSFTFSFMIGLLAFWIEELWGLQNLKDVMIILLGGIALPYQFFPVWLQKSLVYTPFPYLINWPLRKGFTGSFTLEVIITLVWILTFALLSKLFWQTGLKKYSALGTY